MKGYFYEISSNVNQDKLIQHLAQDLYEEIMKKCKRLARYGEFEVEFDLYHSKTFEYIPRGLEEYVFNKTFKLMGDLKMNEKGIISWKPIPIEERVATITARELISIGYNPAEGDLFKRILEDLTKAIRKGEATTDTVESQLIWVKNNFSINL